MMLMIIKIVRGDSKLQKGRREAARGQHKTVFCSGDVLIADRRWGHRRYTRITRTRDGLPAPTSFSAACSAAALTTGWLSVAGAKNTELFAGGMTLMVLDWRAICGTRHLGFSAS